MPWPAFGLNWAVRWLSHAIGLLIVTPMVLTWAQRRHINWSLRRLLEASVLLLVVLLISLVVFNPRSDPNSGLLLLLYTIFPLLTWVAVRFGPRETVSISLVSSLVAAMGTARGVGPFARPDLGEGILLLWAYVSSTAMIALFLSASIQERRQFVAAFQRTLNQSGPPQAAVPLPESAAPVLPLLNLTPRLTLVAVGSLIAMFIYVLTTNLLWPQLTIWLSGAITVVFSTVVACIGSYVVLRRQQTLYEHIFENVIERKRLEADQRRSKIRTQELERVTDRLQREINERQKAENALRHSEQKYRAIVENQIDLVCRFQPDFTLTFVNQAYCNYFAKMPEELIGHSFLTIIPQSRHAEVIQSITTLIESPRILLYEHQVLLPDDELVWQQWINVPMFDSEGHVIEFQAVGRDITELKTLEAHIKQSNIRLEQAIQEKTTEMERLMERLIRQEKLAAVGQISANIAHELRNPLAAVKQAGYYLNQLYLRGQLDANNPKVVEHLRLIESEIDDTEQVIQDLLEAT
ncbi:MAG: MASE1 domain-containing protein, partial [Anaerolineae bacterium]|nr:MASE1 domain-containing protein [Anaerolineae bacterium]